MHRTRCRASVHQGAIQCRLVHSGGSSARLAERAETKINPPQEKGHTGRTDETVRSAWGHTVFASLALICGRRSRVVCDDRGGDGKQKTRKRRWQKCARRKEAITLTGDLPSHCSLRPRPPPPARQCHTKLPALP